MSDSLAARALAYFEGLGYSTPQAAGIVGNISGESGFNINAVGDGGKAYGLAQWHPDRQAEFKKVFGKDIRQSTFDEQLAFIAHELKGSESNANFRLKESHTIQEATEAFMRYYERPANMSSLGDRVKAAIAAAEKGGSWQDWWNDTSPYEGASGQGVLDSLASPLETVISWIPRLVAIIVGVILIGLAIAALMNKTDTIVNMVQPSGV